MSLKITPSFVIEVLKVMITLLTVIVTHLGKEVTNV